MLFVRPAAARAIAVSAALISSSSLTKSPAAAAAAAAFVAVTKTSSSTTRTRVLVTPTSSYSSSFAILGATATTNRRRTTTASVVRRTMSTSEENNDTTMTTTTTATTVTDVAANLEHVRENMRIACEECDRSVDAVRLVAVSKVQPISKLHDAYSAGQRYFGENYVQELLDKVPQLPGDVYWHFIGPLQSNKANALVGAFGTTEGNGAGLSRLTVETVATEKLANKLNSAVEAKCANNDDKLKIYVQINTSDEDTKSGIVVTGGSGGKDDDDSRLDYTQLDTLVRHILDNCPRLQLAGVMTIGAPDDYTCFDKLVQCQKHVLETVLELADGGLEISMGMSGDYTEAIRRGATNIRVGSTIFGARHYPPKK